MIRDRAVVGLSRQAMAWRAAQDIADGAHVNLGIGIPEMVATYVPPGREVIYHSENGILGFGPRPEPGHEDPELINAGKKPITLQPGTSFFHHADSFAMIRGGHIDICILGAMQVAANGDLANWSTGEGAVPAVGGAMDLVAGVKQVFIITEHTTKDKAPKLLARCTYPLTGAGVVTRVFTNFGVFDVRGGRFILREIAPGIDVEMVRATTEGPLDIAADMKTVAAPELT